MRIKYNTLRLYRVNGVLVSKKFCSMRNDSSHDPHENKDIKIPHTDLSAGHMNHDRVTVN